MEDQTTFSAYFTVLPSKGQKWSSSEAKNMRCVRCEEVLTEGQCQNWFAKFRSGNFNLEDAPRPGWPLEADVDKIKSLVDANRRITTREIADRLNLSSATVHKHTKRLGLFPSLTSCLCSYRTKFGTSY